MKGHRHQAASACRGLGLRGPTSLAPQAGAGCTPRAAGCSSSREEPRRSHGCSGPAKHPTSLQGRSQVAGCGVGHTATGNIGCCTAAPGRTPGRLGRAVWHAARVWRRRQPCSPALPPTGGGAAAVRGAACAALPAPAAQGGMCLGAPGQVDAWCSHHPRACAASTAHVWSCCRTGRRACKKRCRAMRPSPPARYRAAGGPHHPSSRLPQPGLCHASG